MSTQLTGTGPVVVAQELYVDSSAQLHNLGELVHSNDGRMFRYCKVGDTALIAGTLQQASAEDTTNQQNLIAATNSIGDILVVTTDTVTLAKDLLAGGFLSIESATTGAGFTYKIKGNTVAEAAVVTFELEDPIVLATTGTVNIDVSKNPYDAVIIGPQTETSAPVGWAIANITELQFGWLCTHGPTTALAQGTVTVGDDVVVAGASADGAVAPAAAGTLSGTVGYAITGIASTDYGLVYATID
jgi:hypothetical protein